MLSFLRKHQKIIFGIITVFVIASFSFFGTYSAIEKKQEVPDRVIGKALDGSDMMLLEISHLKKLLDSDGIEAHEKDSLFNLLGDGVVRKDILEPGLGEIFFDQFKDKLKDEFSLKTSEFRKFKPYLHPQKIIGVEAIWKHFMPAFYADYQKFQKEENISESFRLLSRLYVAEGHYPPSMLRSMLLYQQNQYRNWLAPDPYLQNGDLSLFRAKSISDWFGPKFLHLSALVIHNVALFAEAKGYKVGLEEAKAHLMKTMVRNLKKIDQNYRYTADELDRLYQRQILNLGMSEKSAIKAWQKVLLFRRILDDVGTGVIVDSLVYKQFHDYASKGAKVALYRLPKALALSSLEEKLLLEVYLDAVTNAKVSGLPREFLSLSEVAQKAPELVEKRFLIRFAKASRDELELNIPLRQVLEWQLLDENWKKLAKEFPEVEKCLSTDKEKRFAHLQNLEEGIKEKIDRFSKTNILRETPQIIREKLSSIETRPHKLSISLKGEGEILPGIKDRKFLTELLEKGALLGGQADDFPDVSEKLSCYTEDNEIYYRIRIVDRAQNYEVISFTEAKQRGILESLLKVKLEKEHETVASDKSFEEAKPDLIKSLAMKACKKLGIDKVNQLNSEEVIGSALRKYRLATFVAGERESLEKGIDPSRERRSELVSDRLEESLPLELQWCLEKEELTLMRKKAHPLFSEDLLKMKESDLSLVIESERHGPVFFKVIEPFTDEGLVGKGMAEGRHILGNEAKAHLIKKLTRELEEKKLIAFTDSEMS